MSVSNDTLKIHRFYSTIETLSPKKPLTQVRDPLCARNKCSLRRNNQVYDYQRHLHHINDLRFITRALEIFQGLLLNYFL